MFWLIMIIEKDRFPPALNDRGRGRNDIGGVRVYDRWGTWK
jgi:hypothetical protein